MVLRLLSDDDPVIAHADGFAVQGSLSTLYSRVTPGMQEAVVAFVDDALKFAVEKREQMARVANPAQSTVRCGLSTPQAVAAVLLEQMPDDGLERRAPRPRRPP